MKSETKAKRKGSERIFEGLGVSPGVAIGPAHVREAGEIQVPEYKLAAAKIPAEIERFQKAVEKGSRQIKKLKTKAESFHGTAAEELGYLLDAHLQMLSSTRLTGGIEKRITEDRRNAESAVMSEISAIAQNFMDMGDAYLQTRAQEVREVGLRILRSLTEAKLAGFGDLPKDSIIIAEDITPADTALMDPQLIAGFASLLGGAEGHTAIMARSLGLPAVLGVADLMGGVGNGDLVIVDGSNGIVIVNPTAKRLKDYQSRLKAQAREVRALARLRDLPAETRDGESVVLQANLELPREIGQASAAGAEGVGLLRTEFLFMNREDLPNEDEQYEAIKEVINGMGGRPVNGADPGRRGRKTGDVHLGNISVGVRTRRLVCGRSGCL